MNNNYISPNKKRVRYKFATSLEDFKSIPVKKTFSFFYQIATFPETDKNGIKKYHLRKFVFDNQHNFVNIEDYKLSSSDCKKFYKRYPVHKYKQYDVLNLDMINPPCVYDLQTSISTNLEASESSSILDSMYGSVTNNQIDYKKLYKNKGINGVFSPIVNMDQENLDDNVVTNFSNFN